MNLAKCSFRVSASNFLGFLVHHQGIEVDNNKPKAILEVRPPCNKKELKNLLGMINLLRRFIMNLAGKMKAFSPLLRQRNSEEMIWGEEQQYAIE